MLQLRQGSSNGLVSPFIPLYFLNNPFSPYISLELNIHQGILADIASNVGESQDDSQHPISLLAPNVDVGESSEGSGKTSGKEAICAFISDVVDNVKAGDGEPLPSNDPCSNPHSLAALDVLTQLTPAIHGLYRAIISTSFPWTLPQRKKLCARLNNICSPTMVDRLNHLITALVQYNDSDSEIFAFVQTFIARYVSRGCPADTPSCGASSRRRGLS